MCGQRAMNHAKLMTVHFTPSIGEHIACDYDAPIPCLDRNEIGSSATIIRTSYSTNALPIGNHQIDLP